MSAGMALVLLALTQVGKPPSNDLGLIDQPRAPAIEPQRRQSRDDQGTPIVELRAWFQGHLPETSKAKHVYFLVNPLSNPDTINHWWVQDLVGREGLVASGSCQFGELDAGSGEYFAVVALACDEEYTTGERLIGLPRGFYSRPAIVKRRN